MPLPYVLLAAVLFFAAAVLLRCALMRRSQKRSVRFAVLAGGILAVSAALIGVKAAAVSRETYGPRPFTDTNGTVLTEYIDKAGTHSYYTADGCLYRTVSSEGEVWEYDRDGILTYHKDAKSGEKWYENGTLSRERNKKGAEKRYNGELVTYTKSAHGFREWFEYDENGLLSRRYASNGTETRYVNGIVVYTKDVNKREKDYDGQFVTHIKEANGFEEWFEYDENGLLSHKYANDGSETRYAGGKEIYIKKSNGFETCLEYDENGLLSREYSNDLTEKRYVNGQVVYSKNTDGSIREYENNLLTYTKDTNGLETWYEYNDKGLLSCKYNSNGFEEWFEYDENRKLSRKYDSYGSETRYVDGKVVYEKSNGNIREYENEQLIYTNYSGEETRYADGKVVYEKKDCGLEIWFEYDENGKLEKSHTNNGNTYTYRYFDGDRTPYIYIGNGRWSSDTPEEIHHSGDWTEKDEDGNDYLCFLANYEYIDNGKIVQITQGESITWWEFYDSQGTVLNHPYIWGTVQYDEMQRPISAVNYFTQNDLQYNEDGYLISITSNYFSQVTVYSFEYDENNVLVYSRETCPSYDGVFSDECWYQDGKIIKTKSSNGDTCDETYVSDTDTVLRDENGLIQKVYTHDYNGNNQETTYEYEFDSYDNIKHIIEKESYFDSDGALTEVYITDYYPEYDEFGKIIAETTKKRNWDDVLYNAHRSIRWMFRN